MRSEGKVRVIVRSRKAPARVVDVSLPTFTPSGVFIGMARNRRVVYDHVLDDEHRRAIEAGRKLSSDLGIELEVIDAGRRNVLGRVLSSLGLGSNSPSLQVTSHGAVGQSPAQITATSR